MIRLVTLLMLRSWGDGTGVGFFTIFFGCTARTFALPQLQAIVNSIFFYGINSEVIEKVYMKNIIK